MGWSASALELRIGPRLPPVVRCGTAVDVPVSLANLGSSSLRAPDEALNLAYHVWDAAGGVVVWDGVRSPLPSVIHPGETRRFTARLAAPAWAGAGRVQFALVSEGVGWSETFAAGSEPCASIRFEPPVGDSPFDWHAALESPAARAALTPNGQPRPLGLACETINVCNNACVFCAYPHQTRARGLMGMGLFARVLDQYAEIGGGRISLTALGEPLLDPLLAQRLDAIDGHPAVSGASLTSNASVAARLDRGRLRRIVPRLDPIQISIYGADPVEHRAITGRDSFEAMLEGTRRILTLASGTVVLAFRTARLRTRDELFDWLERRLPALRSRASLEVRGPLAEFGNWGLFRPTDGLFDGARWRAEIEHKSQCLLPALALKVFWDGKVSFCPCGDFDRDPELALGDVGQLSLAEICRSRRFRELWHWSRCGVPEVCRRCSFYQPIDDAGRIPGFFDPARAVIA